MRNHVIFIVNSIKQARCIRRIEEFIDHGYQVEVYGFDREGDNRKMPNLPLKTIGSFKNGSDYFNRLRTIRNAIKKNIGHQLAPQDTLFFLFNLDIVLAFRSIYGSYYKYIYEVSDLTELVVRNTLVRKFLIWQNRISMQNAAHVVFTSEGFCDFYNQIPRDKISVIPNKVSPNCPRTENLDRILNPQKIKIGFVGIIRFETILKFARACSAYNNIEFHLYGLISEGDQYALELKRLADTSYNIIMHGPFRSPNDLPSIYEKIDLVLSAYPPTPGVIYAEPNKLYEAIYFRCPIIVNQGTFLGKKVGHLNVGYVIDAMNENSIKQFLEALNASDYQAKVDACKSIPQNECINRNDDFFKQIENL